MKISENRGLAIVIAAAVVVGSTLVSGARGLEKACDNAERAFFKSSDKAPSYYVNNAVSAAASLAAVGSHYDSLEAETAAIRSARSELVEAYEDKDIEDMGRACEALTAATDDFVAGVGGVSLTAEDQSAFDDASDTVYGAARQIGKSGYDEDTEAFIRKVYDRFPASLFAALFDVDAPELFRTPGASADD